MFAAVFRLDMLLAARRRRTYLLRGLYLLFLAALAAPMVLQEADLHHWLTAGAGQETIAGLLEKHFFLLVLATPAFVAGAVTEEKDRGTLGHLLTTPLTGLEILLGKLLARSLQLGLVLLLGLPLFCFLAGLLEDPALPFAVLAVSVGLALGLGALALLLSVWSRSTRDALLLAYLLTFAVVAVWGRMPPAWKPAWSSAGLEPIRALALDDPSRRWFRIGAFLRFWCIAGVICLAMGSWWLRRAYRHHLGRRDPGRFRFLRRARRRVKGNPVQWRETHFEPVMPLPGLRWCPRWLAAAGFAPVSLAVLAGCSLLVLMTFPGFTFADFLNNVGTYLGEILVRGLAEHLFAAQGFAVLALLSILALVRSSAAITGEKERHTWASLLLTPMTTRRILQGKRWGILWAALPLIVCHGLIALPLAWWYGGWGCATWAALCTALMPPAILLACSMGLWASARSRSSWRSLLTASTCFFFCWLAFSLPVSCLALLIRGFLAMIVFFIGLFADTSAAQAILLESNLIGIVLVAGLGLAYLYLNHRLLAATEDRIGRNDRTMEFDFSYFFLFRDIERRQRELAAAHLPWMDWAEKETSEKTGVPGG